MSAFRETDLEVRAELATPYGLLIGVNLPRGLCARQGRFWPKEAAPAGGPEGCLLARSRRSHRGHFLESSRL